MSRFRKHSMASALALAFSLSACGGGGSGLRSTPPAPIAPTPDPPPPPPGVVEAAARGSVPDASVFPSAVSGGATMQQHPTTKFPLLQSVVSISGISATANTAVMNGGSTLTFDSTPTSNDHHYKISVPALGFSDLALVAGGSYYCNSLCGYAGSTPIELEIADPTTSDLSWMTYGTWDAFNSGRTRGYFVTGFETPISSVPTTGTATYRGSTDGEVIYPVANGVRSTSLIGLAELQANFGTGNIGGNLTSMTADGVPWNSISLLGAISSARNSFSGTAAASSAPGGTWSLLSSASGTLSGRFFGPGAQELGAIWTLFDGNATAVGSIAAKKGP